MPTTTNQPNLGPAMTLGQDIYTKGQGLLNRPVAQNGYGRNFGSVAPNSFGGRNAQAPQLNTTATVNPWLQQQGRAIRQQTNDMLGQGLLGIQGNSVASGGLGGSRQGVAQGVAMGNAANYMSGNLANLYGQAYENDANRNLQKYGMDTQSYNQQRGQDMDFFGQNQQFFGQQRGQDLLQTNMGAGLIDQGLNTQWSPLRNLTNVVAPFTGQGTTSSSTSSGGGWQGALGGALSGLALANYFK